MSEQSQSNNNALIGYSGYVGSTLLKQQPFSHVYRSTTINSIKEKSFDTVICSAAPAQKWIANREPVKDKEKIDYLIEHLKTIQCNRFVLISTVDVFKEPNAVDENTPIEQDGLHAYGLHRFYLEEFVRGHFQNHLIVRLPGLVGPGLRKNVIFDLLNDNNLEVIDSRHVFQFYPMINLFYDIDLALTKNLDLLHLTAAPISVADVAKLGFNRSFNQHLDRPIAQYDMRSIHSNLFINNNGNHDNSVSNHYQYTVRESIQAIRAYAQTETTRLQDKK